jgi:hypothetical protein
MARKPAVVRHPGAYKTAGTHLQQGLEMVRHWLAARVFGRAWERAAGAGAG